MESKGRWFKQILVHKEILITGRRNSLSPQKAKGHA